MHKWFEIFRTGTHKSSDGKIKKWTEEDLNRMATSYDSASHEAPIVVGHPTSNAPAYGWVKQLRVTGGTLLARAKQMDPQFVDLVRKGRFKKRSISVYPDGTLRHVGFLGAQPPAVKGLKDVSFGDQEAVIYEYQDMEDTMFTVEELQDQLAAEKEARRKAEEENKDLKAKAAETEADFAEAQKKHRRAELDAFVDQGIKDGKILPAWKKLGLAEFMAELEEQTETYEFAEGKNATPAAWFRGFITSFAEHPLFKEMTRPQEDKGGEQKDFAEDEKIAREIAGIEEDK